MEKLTLNTGKRMTLFEFGIGLLNGPIKLLTIESPDEALSLFVIQAIEQKKIGQDHIQYWFFFYLKCFHPCYHYQVVSFDMFEKIVNCIKH